MDTSVFKPDDTVTFIQKHPDIYLGPGRQPSADLLVSSVVGDALILGVELIVVQKVKNAYFVLSETNWIKIERKYESSYQEIFNKISTFPKAGINSIRSEPLIMAFSSDVAIVQDSYIQTIKGNQFITGTNVSDANKLRYGLGFIIAEEFQKG